MNTKELCKNIQNNVSKLNNIEIIELFKIILETGENYTKNNNGVFINLNWLNDETIHKINNYISFCIKSQNEITKYELMKSLLNDSIVSKEELNINEVDGYLTLFFYKEGDRFPIHIDRIQNTEFYYDAVYNVNVLLNEDYEGGEFVLNNIEYKQPAGLVYYYESTKPHGVKTVKSGSRYTLIYFVRERDFERKKHIL